MGGITVLAWRLLRERPVRRWWLPGVPTRGPAGVASSCLPAQAAAVSGEEQMGW